MANEAELKGKLTLPSIDLLKGVWAKIEPHIGFGYAVVLLVGIMCVIYLVGQTLQSDSPGLSSSSESPYSTKFDDTTVGKVRALNSDLSTSTTVVLPGGRINPFAE